MIHSFLTKRVVFYFHLISCFRRLEFFWWRSMQRIEWRRNNEDYCRKRRCSFCERKCVAWNVNMMSNGGIKASQFWARVYEMKRIFWAIWTKGKNNKSTPQNNDDNIIIFFFFFFFSLLSYYLSGWFVDQVVNTCKYLMSETQFPFFFVWAGQKFCICIRNSIWLFLNNKIIIINANTNQWRCKTGMLKFGCRMPNKQIPTLAMSVTRNHRQVWIVKHVKRFLLEYRPTQQ